MDNTQPDPVSAVEQPTAPQGDPFPVSAPVDPQALQPEPSVNPETPAPVSGEMTDAGANEQPAQPQPEVKTVSPEEDFMNAYKALCAEKGYEIGFEIKPLFDGKFYDLSKLHVAYSVEKIK